MTDVEYLIDAARRFWSKAHRDGACEHCGGLTWDECEALQDALARLDAAVRMGWGSPAKKNQRESTLPECRGISNSVTPVNRSGAPDGA
jgi:hypothetical protein